MDTLETPLAIWGNYDGFEAAGFEEPRGGGEIRGSKSPSPDPDPPIVVPRDWRWAAANLPPERWSRWRRYTGEFLASLDEHADVADIRAAERAAFDLLTDGGTTR
jgi:hypothetical protein